MKKFDALDLLICEEWGYVPIDSDGSKLLFTVVSECYERKTIIITTNLEIAKWNDIITNTKITAALLDRIIYHSHLLDFTSRDSRYLMDALRNKISLSIDFVESVGLAVIATLFYLFCYVFCLTKTHKRP